MPDAHSIHRLNAGRELRTSRCTPLLVVTLLALPTAGVAGQDTTLTAPQNPFAGFETHVLDNGLRLWYRHLPGAPNASMGVSVPYGWDLDPEGKGELAHFTEHMLFSDHRGRTEEEIKDEIESRGGERNAFTTPDRTFYYVTLPTEHGLFGLEWLSRIIEPHAMLSGVVDSNRQPVALEIRARPRQLFDHLGAWLDPNWLRRPSFWAREFGLETRLDTRYDRYRNLEAITAADLRDFYDRYYTPGAMTLVVVGDLPRDSVIRLVEATFGALEARPVPPSYGETRDPGRAYRRVLWTYRPNVRYRRYLKVYEVDGPALERLLFLGFYLQRRLGARLRFGETKAVYSIGTGIVMRGPAAYFRIDAPIDRDRWEYARDVIDEELQALATGSLPEEDFRADRDAVVERLISDNRAAEDLVFWVFRSFYRPELHDSFPDLASTFASLEQEELAAFVSDRFVPERGVTYIDRPQPITQGIFLAIVLMLGALTIKGMAHARTAPIEMREIRYVARLRLSPLALMASATIMLAVAVVAGRLIGFMAERVAYAWVLPVDVYAYQMAAFALFGVGVLVLVVLYLGIPPRKLLVFTDHVRVKYLAYRSRRIPFDEIRSVRLASLGDVIGARHRTVPLALGLREKAIYLELTSGTGYFFRVRDPEELLDVLRELGAPVAALERDG